MSEELWYYSQHGVQEGPVSLSELRQMLESGHFGAQDMVWKEGMATWMPPQRVAELADVSMPPGASPPPLRSAPPAQTPAALPAPEPSAARSWPGGRSQRRRSTGWIALALIVVAVAVGGTLLWRKFYAPPIDDLLAAVPRETDLLVILRGLPQLAFEFGAVPRGCFRPFLDGHGRIRPGPRAGPRRRGFASRHRTRYHRADRTRRTHEGSEGRYPGLALYPTEEKGFDALFAELGGATAADTTSPATALGGLLETGHRQRQKRTVMDIRNLGTAYLSWLTDQIGAASAGSRRYSLDRTAKLRTRDEIRADLHLSEKFFYMKDIPFEDGWGHPLEVWISDNLLSSTVIMVRSPSRDGIFEQEQPFPLGAFDPDDFDQDIIWADGYFVRWPGKE